MILPSWRREGEGRGRMELETGHPGGRCLAQTPKFKTSQSRFLRSASLEGRPAQPASARPSATLHNPNEPTPSDGGRVGAGWGQGGASSTCCIRCLMRRGPGQGRAGQGRAGQGTALHGSRGRGSGFGVPLSVVSRLLAPRSSLSPCGLDLVACCSTLLPACRSFYAFGTDFGRESSPKLVALRTASRRASACQEASSLVCLLSALRVSERASALSHSRSLNRGGGDARMCHTVTHTPPGSGALLEGWRVALFEPVICSPERPTRFFRRGTKIV